MAKVKNLNKAIGKEPEVAGVEIERKSPRVNEAGQATVAPNTAAAPPKRESPLTEPFPARQNAARPMAGKTPRPTDNRGE
ncbi:hypothetical protein [Mesorhizobium sp. STM 4661]|uniref:hypothetical protein n=1 Tax=Mesorhizobium sp. STM 4661 TaxID=1297570 RepID=UPI0002BEB8D1|nr:hypothetical protein [Mesorhizobium sp. STM 4661]CCV15423.1 hypothetical protein MESS4_780014 [Mesorhizobium sp. STM 4661]